MTTDQSLDERLRTAFGEQDDAWDPRAEHALREVGRRHARGVVVRRGLAAGALAAAVMTGVVLLGNDRLGGDAAPDPIGPPTPPAQTDPASPGVTPSVLEGRWRTPLLDQNDLRVALQRSGDEQYADQVLSGLRPRPFRLVWLVSYETAELRLVSADGPEVLDKISLTVGDDQVTMFPRFDEGSTVHRFVVTGDELRMTFVSTTEATTDGVPGEVWQQVLYDAAPFTRR